MQAPVQPDRFEHVRRQFKGVNGAFAEHNTVFTEISERMLARLNLLVVEPDSVLDLGCRDGYQLDALQQRFPQASVIGVDPAAIGEPPVRWWHRNKSRAVTLSGDPHQLPFSDGSFDLVVSNLFLPWCHDPTTVFAEVARVLSENGAFLFTSLGPDTLHEYASLWQAIDSSQHVFGLADMHVTGDELLGAGFAAPVLDREVITVDYPSVASLEAELRHIGAANLALGRRAGLMSGSVRKRVNAAAQDSRFSVTLELVNGHGWKGALEPHRNSSQDEFSVSLDSLRQSLRGSGG